MSKRNRKNGFSLAEAVIALAVITLVTVAALSMSFSAVLARMNIVNRSYAQGFAADVLECFKAATSEDEFVDLVNNFSTGDEDPNLIKENDTYTYTSEEHQFTAEIKIDYNINRPTLTVKITDNNDEIIIELDNYKKGVKQ